MSASTPNAFLNIDDAHLRVTSGNVYAQGLNISGVSFSGVSGLHTVTNTGNVTTNTLEFKNGAKAFVATSNVEVKGSLDVANVATIYNGSNADYDQKQKFTSTVSSSGNYFANTLAMSTNGLYAIVGAHGENKTYTFTRSGSTWTQEHTFSSTGYAVDISSHGTYAVVGANGSASVFYRSSGSTWDSGTTLTAAGISVTTGYGASVSISDDGSYAIVGATGQSAAWIFRRTGTTTWDAGVKIALTGFSLGFSVAISGDGLYALLGAHAQHTAYVFKRTGAYLWSQQAKITESDSFGYSVALSTDGSRALIGATGGNGKAYSYERAGSGWSQNAIITASDAASGDAFGSAVSLSSDGSYGIVGAPGSEKAYTFKNAGSVWTELGIETASDTASGHVFGRSVSISGDGIYALIGASGNEAAYSYERKETLVLDVRGEANVRTLNVSDDLIVTNNILVSNNLTVAGNLNVTTIRSDSNVVAEYTGPHDRPLRKYPEVALTQNDESATSGYVASTNNKTTGTSGVPYRDAFMAYDGFFSSQNSTWQTLVNSYDSNGDDVSGDTFTAGGTNYVGHWNKLQIPNSIKVEKIEIIAYVNGTDDQRPDQGAFLGSTDGTNWELIYSFSSGTLSWSESGDASGIRKITTITDITNTNRYNYLVLVVEKIPSASAATQLGVAELRYYGHEEGSGSLDTTLKTVYNVPATTGTQLEVYYDGQDYTQPSDFAGLGGVVDKAGGDQDGTAGTGVGFDTTYKAFVFDGSTDGKITTSIINDSGDWVHSASVWVKVETGQVVVTSAYISLLGTTDSASTRIAFDYKEDESAIRLGINAAYIQWNNVIVPNHWHHITYTYKGGSIRGENYNLYVDGKYVEHSTTFNDAAILTLAQNTNLSLGQSHLATNYLKGSIANFRLYSKALNADQIKELYDYQKDYFLGSKSQVTLYKGHLGVGVTEPSGQLELAGDERIQEYPPGPMSGYETLIPGHGVFCASASTEHNTNRLAWMAFNDESGETSGDSSGFWRSEYLNSTDGPYNGSTGAYISNARLGSDTALGEYVVLQLPYKIQLRSLRMSPNYRTVLDDFDIAEFPKNFTIYGSNDGNNWYSVFVSPSQTLTAASGSGATTETTSYTIANNEYYKYFGLVVTETNYGNYSVVGHGTSIGNLQYFGTPGPTTLDKGSLTLGRSLDVPRISRYDVDTETPRPEKLVLDFDTTVNSSPTDISGKGNHGAFKGTAQYSPADKAFKFDGNSDWIQTTATGTSGNFIHSVSMWVKSEVPSTSTTSRTAFHMGNAGVANQEMQIQFNYNANTVYLGTHVGWLTMSNMEDIIKQNQWHHIAYTYNGTNMLPTNTKFYIDGKQMTMGNGSSSTLSFPSSTEDVFLGRFNSSGSQNWWDGQISNPKLYSVALEASEVKKLYRLGRTGRSMVISDTAVGIGKVPEAQLDVRGSISATGTIRSRRPMWSVGFQTGSSHNLPLTEVAMLWAPVNYDYTGNYDSSTGYYTIPITGYYAIGVRALIQVPAAQNRVDGWVKKISGGVTTRVIMGERLAGTEGGRATGHNLTCQVHGTVYLQSGDQVYAGYTGYTVSQGYVLSISTDFNEFHGHLIEEVIS